MFLISRHEVCDGWPNSVRGNVNTHVHWLWCVRAFYTKLGDHLHEKGASLVTGRAANGPMNCTRGESENGTRGRIDDHKRGVTWVSK